jgi:hypothetical protein
MTDPSPSPLARRQIARLAEDALQRSEAVGVLPTPLAAVQEALGIVERLDMSDLPAAVEAKKPRAWKRILGAYLRDERVVFIDREQPKVRQFWTDGHEAAHAMCRWHGEILRLDNESTLFRQLHPGVETEANFGAGQLVFQGGRFHRRALEDQIAIATPLALADEYGASRHATLRFYVEEHPYPLALLVCGRYPYADGTLPIWNSIQSASFERRFGRLQDQLPGGRLSLGEGEGAPLAEIVRASRLALGAPSTVLKLADRRGRERKFLAEAFFNTRCNFVLVVDQKAARLGRRVRLASAASGR